METLALAWAQPIVIAVATGWIGFRLGARQEQEKERRARTLMAATELTSALRDLQVLLRRHGRDPMPSNEVPQAFIAWAKAYDSHGHRLPAGYRHIARSVRDATGTVFGGISLVHVRPDTELLGLADPHAMWQDYADDYLDYLARHLLQWGDSERAAAKTVMTYEAWLVRTERRRPIGTNHAAQDARHGVETTGSPRGQELHAE